jgi:hypothetical protein
MEGKLCRLGLKSGDALERRLSVTRPPRTTTVEAHN